MQTDPNAARLQGDTSVAVKFGGDPIAKSPFTVGVAAPLDLSKVTLDHLDGSKTALCFRSNVCVWMLNDEIFISGVEVAKEQQFQVGTRGAGGQGQLEVAVVSVKCFSFGSPARGCALSTVCVCACS